MKNKKHHFCPLRRKTIDFLTGHFVDVEFWDAKKERAKEGFNKNNQTASDRNRTIDESRPDHI
ncbi:MAG: hypothetical protein LBK94_00400 [Prevotellaceae bacterium]|jgi:hypothetical protein|nr:hypothetical protein [Prevotellaceae bacterium]